MTRGEIVLYGLAQFQSVDVRHHHVAEYDVRHFVAYHLQGFGTIYGSACAVEWGEERREQLTYVVVVFDNEYYRALVVTFGRVA